MVREDEIASVWRRILGERQDRTCYLSGASVNSRLEMFPSGNKLHG